jgi:hypothetical protein
MGNLSCSCNIVTYRMVGVTKITDPSSDDWIYWHFGYIYFNYNQYSAISDLHNLQFIVAHAVGFCVFTSRLLATDLKTENSTSNHYEVLLLFRLITLYSSVLFCTQLIFTIHKDILHSRPCTLN